MKIFYLILGVFLIFGACADDEEKVVQTPLVEDASLTLSVDKVTLSCAGGTAEVKLETNQEIWDAVPSAGWLTVEKGNSSLILKAAKNETGEQLTATLLVTAGVEENADTAVITVVQNDNSLVLEYTVPARTQIMLPICGLVKCSVDWGDGQTEEIDMKIDNISVAPPRHMYTAAGTYLVRISGEVPELYSMIGFSDEQRACLSGIKQWGKTGLTALRYAFYRCINIESLPPDTDDSFAEVTSFENAFSNCTALKELPEGLFASAVNAETFRDCFYKCTALTSLPARMFDNCSKATIFVYTFGDCPLVELPEGLFKDCIEAVDFNSCFTNCMTLRVIPENLFANCPKVTDFSYCFRNAQSLINIPAKLFNNCTLAEKMVGIFTYCYSLTSIPEELFRNCPEISTFSYCFTSCTSLTGVPAGLFDNNRKVVSFKGTFRDCVSLTGESPYTEIGGKKVHLYERRNYGGEFVTLNEYDACFRNCNGLSDYNTMPSAWNK